MSEKNNILLKITILRSLINYEGLKILPKVPHQT